MYDAAGQLQATAIHGKGYLEHMPGNGSAAHDHDHFEQYHLRLKSGEIRHLSFPKTPSYVGHFCSSRPAAAHFKQLRIASTVSAGNVPAIPHESHATSVECCSTSVHMSCAGWHRVNHTQMACVQLPQQQTQQQPQMQLSKHAEPSIQHAASQ